MTRIRFVRSEAASLPLSPVRPGSRECLYGGHPSPRSVAPVREPSVRAAYAAYAGYAEYAEYAEYADGTSYEAIRRVSGEMNGSASGTAGPSGTGPTPD